MSPSSIHFNLHGLNRYSSVSSSHLAWTSLDSDALSSMLTRYDACFFNGDLKDLFLLHDAWSTIDSSNSPTLFIALSSEVRLRTLSKFTAIHWLSVTHDQVGGCSRIRAWIGSSKPLRNPSSPSPNYPTSIISNILKYAPRDMYLKPLNPQFLLPQPYAPTQQPVPFSEPANIWYSHGIFPHSVLFNTQNLPQIICESPYSSTKVGVRDLSMIELTRLLDLPAPYAKRCHSAFGTHTSHDTPIIESVPGKILLHGFWLFQLIEIHSPNTSSSGGGYPNLPPSSDIGLLMSQEEFNVGVNRDTSVDVVAAKNDKARVPVEIWNRCLIHKMKDSLATDDESVICSSLTILRKFALQVWRKKVLLSFINYLKTTYGAWWNAYLRGKRTSISHGLLQDIKAGVDCIQYSTDASWWEWDMSVPRLYPILDSAE